MLFSGGRDSTTCLAWALSQFAHVETIGFDYGQRHRIEMDVRLDTLRELRNAFPQWSNRLGDDHVIDLAVLGQISETSLTRDVAIAYEQSGCPTRLCRAATCCSSPSPPPSPIAAGSMCWSAACARQIFRLPGLPRQHHEGDAARAVARVGSQAACRNTADVDRQGTDLGAGRSARWRRADRADRGAHPHLLSRRARRAARLGYGCGECPPVRCARQATPSGAQGPA